MKTRAKDPATAPPDWVFRIARDFARRLSGMELPAAIEQYRNRLEPCLSRSLQALLQGTPVVCQARCGVCCHQPLRLSLVEIADIAYHHESTLEDPEIRRRLDDECQVLRHLRKRGPLRPLALATAQFRERRPCLFLNREGSCAIWPNRPFACRNAFATEPCSYDDLCTFGFANLADLSWRMLRAIVRRYRLGALHPGFSQRAHWLPEGLVLLNQAPSREALRSLFAPGVRA